MTDPADLYIDLLKRSVGNFIYDDDLNLLDGRIMVDPDTGKYVLLEGKPMPADSEAKFFGTVWPSRAHSMIGRPRLDNLQECVDKALANDIPGDLIEAGVWRGGATILMRGILKARGVTDRTVWVADSFAGLPPNDVATYPKESQVPFNEFEELAISIEQVRSNFERYDLLDDQVQFLQGWFKDTLPTAPISELAIMRLDGDLYESTMDGLLNLYPKLSSGGFAIIDDYGLVLSADEAVHDYFDRHGIDAEIVDIAGGGAFWCKP